MSILIDENTRVIVQGITGNFGRFHSLLLMEYGTKIVAGVTPGRGGSVECGVPVYDSVAEAVERHRANAAAMFVPAPFVKDAIFESIEAGLELIVCLVEGVPVHDMMMVKKRLEGTRTILLGPNCPGLISPGKSLIGFMPGYIYRPGSVGIVSRSGTFSYQVADAVSRAGYGQSTCVGIGGDPISGISFVEVLERFERDPETEVIVLIGEIGRQAEEEAAEYIRHHVRKPVVGIILGRTAPPDKQMGHAGAIVSAGRGSYESKVRALEAAGVRMALTAGEVARLVGEALRGVKSA